MYPASFEYFAPATLEEALSILDEQGDDGEGPRRRSEPDSADEASLRVARGARRHEPDRRARRARRGGRRAADRRARPAHRTCERSELLRGRYRAARRRGAADLRPDRPQPRHRLRLARPRRSTGRLGRGDARRRAPRSACAAPRGKRTIPIDEFFQGPFTTVARAERDRHRGARPRSGRARRRDVPEARAQGRRLRHCGGRASRSRLLERHDRRGRHRAHRRRADEHPGERCRGGARAAPSRARRRSGKRRASPRRRPSRSRTCAAPPSTSETSFGSSPSADCGRPPTRPGRLRREMTAGHHRGGANARRSR